MEPVPFATVKLAPDAELAWRFLKYDRPRIVIVPSPSAFSPKAGSYPDWVTPMLFVAPSRNSISAGPTTLYASSPVVTVFGFVAMRKA